MGSGQKDLHLVSGYLIPSCQYDVKQFNSSEFVQHDLLTLEFSLIDGSLASIVVDRDLILQKMMRLNLVLNIKACVTQEGKEELQRCTMILDNVLKTSTDVGFVAGREFLSFLHVGVCTLQATHNVFEFRRLVHIFDLDLVAKLLEETKITKFCSEPLQTRLCTFYSTQLKNRL